MWVMQILLPVSGHQWCSSVAAGLLESSHQFWRLAIVACGTPLVFIDIWLLVLVSANRHTSMQETIQSYLHKLLLELLQIVWNHQMWDCDVCAFRTPFMYYLSPILFITKHQMWDRDVCALCTPFIYVLFSGMPQNTTWRQKSSIQVHTFCVPPNLYGLLPMFRCVAYRQEEKWRHKNIKKEKLFTYVCMFCRCLCSLWLVSGRVGSWALCSARGSLPVPTLLALTCGECVWVCCLWCLDNLETIKKAWEGGFWLDSADCIGATSN